MHVRTECKPWGVRVGVHTNPYLMSLAKATEVLNDLHRWLGENLPRCGTRQASDTTASEHTAGSTHEQGQAVCTVLAMSPVAPGDATLHIWASWGCALFA